MMIHLERRTNLCGRGYGQRSVPSHQEVASDIKIKSKSNHRESWGEPSTNKIALIENIYFNLGVGTKEATMKKEKRRVKRMT